MVGKNAAQAETGQEKAHHMMTEERLHVQVACRGSSSIANATSSISPSRHLWHAASKHGCTHERLGRG